MSKKRDAASGKYISEEESKQKDKSTWVEEKDRINLAHSFLLTMYKELLNRCIDIDGESYVAGKDIKEVFLNSGLREIEELTI